MVLCVSRLMMIQLIRTLGISLPVVESGWVRSFQTDVSGQRGKGHYGVQESMNQEA